MIPAPRPTWNTVADTTSAHRAHEADAVSWARELRWFARQPESVRRAYLTAVDRMGGEIPAAYRIRFEALVARSA